MQLDYSFVLLAIIVGVAASAWLESRGIAKPWLFLGESAIALALFTLVLGVADVEMIVVLALVFVVAAWFAAGRIRLGWQ